MLGNLLSAAVVIGALKVNVVVVFFCFFFQVNFYKSLNIGHSMQKNRGGYNCQNMLPLQSSIIMPNSNL